jgi:hypothetical protein
MTSVGAPPKIEPSQQDGLLLQRSHSVLPLIQEL